MNEQSGLLFAGNLLVSIKNPITGEFGGYLDLQADKFEIKTPSDMTQKISKQRETFGQAWMTYYSGKPAEVSIVLDEVSRDMLAVQLSGEVSDYTQQTGAIAGVDVDVVEGFWMPTGYENLDLATLAVAPVSAGTPYIKDVDYQVNPRTGMIFVPKGGAIPTGKVKFTAAKAAVTGYQIAGGKSYSNTLRTKLDGINLINRQNMLLTCPQITVSAQDAFDFLSGKASSVPLKGFSEIAEGESAPFTLRYF